MNVSAIQAEAPLRARRRALGLSQQRVAELAKCSLSMVRLIEGGYVPQSSDVLRQVAEALEAAASPLNDDDDRASTRSIAHHTPAIEAPDRGSP